MTVAFNHSENIGKQLQEAKQCIHELLGSDGCAVVLRGPTEEIEKLLADIEKKADKAGCTTIVHRIDGEDEISEASPDGEVE